LLCFAAVVGFDSVAALHCLMFFSTGENHKASVEFAVQARGGTSLVASFSTFFVLFFEQ